MYGDGQGGLVLADAGTTWYTFDIVSSTLDPMHSRDGLGMAMLIITLLALSNLALSELVTIAPASARPHGADCESLHCAQLRVRELLAAPLAKEQPADDITVRIAPGGYELTEPLVFGERDHAKDGRRVVWQGPAGGGGGGGGTRQSRSGSARVLGGTVVSGWERAWGDVWKVQLGRRVWSLSENSRQCSPARHPNTNPGAGSGQLNGSASATSFSWHEGALPANVSVFGLGNTTVLMYNDFDINLLIPCALFSSTATPPHITWDNRLGAHAYWMRTCVALRCCARFGASGLRVRTTTGPSRGESGAST